MRQMLSIHELKIDKHLYDFINFEVLPDINIDNDIFWKKFSNIINELNPVNQNLLIKRKEIQSSLNDWYKKKIGITVSKNEYKEYLYKIGYLVKEGNNFEVDTDNVDNEISNISGPQLVVPITNARYALNAVNARWGSLYDAIYGTDILGELPNSPEYDHKRGEEVITYSKKHLDKIAPLINANWNEIIKIGVENNEVKFYINDEKFTNIEDKNQIVGIILNHEELRELIIVKNNLHIRIVIDPNHIIGKADPANISDIILESAISTILDCEDSVATVDADDKILAYRNWLGLMKGTLESEFEKNDKKIKRTLNKDFKITTLQGKQRILKSRSLMLIRNVGHLMTTSAILLKNGDEIGEGLMDGIITSLIALHDLNKKKENNNSIKGSIYIVKPKMHGPEEVSFTSHFFSKIEEMLNLPINTIKVGIMDEERRTSVNLKECIRAAKSRVAFINTGFLDRTGDEIHTSMHFGPFLPKGDMKKSKWIKAYEKRNVEIGLSCGLQGKAQIGKGMWAMPDLMSEMLDKKISHLKEGANCSWVPSPTAATIHAMHYHFINVKDVQNDILKQVSEESIDDLLTIPLLNRKNLSDIEIINEIENNAQGILGYVVRWIDQGIGCSKVPDINNIGLMEDRATCRISSQAIANWLKHDLVSKSQVMTSLKKMALIVDEQNKNDSNYKPMGPDFDTLAFHAAKDLIFKGLNQPSGYTEPILHQKRSEFKKNNN